MLPPSTLGRPTAASSSEISVEVVLLPLLPVTPMVRAACSGIHSAVPPVTRMPADRASTSQGWVWATPGERTSTSAARTAARASEPVTSATEPASSAQLPAGALGPSCTTTRSAGASGAIALIAATASRPVPHTTTRRPASSVSFTWLPLSRRCS